MSHVREKTDAQKFKAGDVVFVLMGICWAKLIRRVERTEEWWYCLPETHDTVREVSEIDLVATPRIIDVWNSPLAFAKDYFAEPERWEVIYSGQKVMPHQVLHNQEARRCRP